MEACPPSSWLPQGDLFDEESCRYFLSEAGEQIVPFYPFSIGIHEVYSILLDKYGKENVADALSVLKELLEGEDNANGLGDDGDIWRSWRHNWRHRNNDPHHASVVQVHGFILPSPTPREERVVKADNFSARSAAYEWRRIENGSKELSSGENEVLPALSMNPETLSSPRRKQHTEVQETTPRLLSPNVPSQKDIGMAIDELLARQSPSARAESEARLLKTFEECKLLEHCSLANRPTGANNLDVSRNSINVAKRYQRGRHSDSEQEFDEVKEWADSIDFDQSELVSFDMLQASQLSQGEPVNVGGPRISTLRAVRTPDGDNAAQEIHSQDTDTNLKAKAVSGRMEQIKTENPLHMDNHFPQSPHSDLSRRSDYLSHSQAQEPLKRRTSTNREARLIDGAIFRPRLRDLVEHHGQDEKVAINKLDSKRSLVRVSWSSSRQKENLRHSWYQGVRSLFQNKQSSGTIRNRGSNNDDGFGDNCEMPSSHKSGVSEPSTTSAVQNSRNYGLGLDGSFDELSHQPKSPINLNKPLPLMPKIPSINKPSSIHMRSSSFDHSQATTDRPSTASTASSGISTTSSRRDFRGLARALLEEDMAGSRPELSPVRETEIMIGSPKQNPQKSPKSENFSFTSIMNGNPFTDAPVPLTPKKPLPLSLRKREPPKASEAQGLPQSRSEPNFQPYKLRKNAAPTPPFPTLLPTNESQKQGRIPKTAEYPIPSYLIRKSPQSLQRSEEETAASARGRTAHRPVSPNHAFKKPNVDSKPGSSESTPKRSKSPVKKFLGFVKSSSAKDLASEPPARSNSSSPEKSKIKAWGNRLRYGLLTTDFEDEPGPQLESKASPERGLATSPPQQSTFPVSLAPTYQAKILSEIELVICVCGNRFLMHEFSAGRVSDSSVARVKEQWAKKNRPQVIEFFYDQGTQRDLIMTNLNSVNLHGESAKNALVLNATMYAWKTMATEMIVRTFCTPDSVIRKYMHDTHKILETLGASLQTFLAFQDLQVKTLGMINEKQRERLERSKERQTQTQTPTKRARVPTPATVFGHIRKSSKEATVESSPSPGFQEAYDAYENSRGGRLGMIVREMSEGRTS